MNYKVMIVDDEPIVCEGLRLFSWHSYGCELVCEAADGVEALALADSVRPDIIISDIKMPEMSGIEFSKIIKQTDPDVEIILLTGYADFAYARQALEIGIHNYLLKPFRLEDIEKALTNCLQVIRERQKNKVFVQQISTQLSTMIPILTRQVFQELLDGTITKPSDKLSVCRITPAKYIVFSTQSDIESSESYNLAIYGLLSEAVAGMEREFYLAQRTDVINCVLCFKQERSDKFCIQATLHFCQMFQKLVQERFGFTISFGISLPSEDIYCLSELRSQSIRALNYRYLLGDCFVMLYSDIENEYSKTMMDLSAFTQDIQKCLLRRNTGELDLVYQKLTAALAGISNGDLNFIKKNVVDLIFRIFHFAEQTLPDIDADIPYGEIVMLINSESLEGFSIHATDLLKSLVPHTPTDRNRAITDKVKTYIEENLEKDLSLELLSGQMNYSTAYLSRMIKKYSGKTFMELLLDCRINRARELLKNTGWKVSEIARKVGYYDHSYFIRTFKKKTGLTPNEYRALYRL